MTTPPHLKGKRTWTLDDLKGFGDQYRTWTVRRIIMEDAEHLVSWLRRLPWFNLDEEAQAFLRIHHPQP